MKNRVDISNFCYAKIFDNLCFSIKKNSFVTISGPNNCGKTTLIRILNREIITDDDIRLNNININCYKVEEYSKLVQCVIPLEIIFDEYTLEEELLRNCNDKKDLDSIVKGLKLKKKLNKNIKDLSQKEIVLFQLSIALIKNPQVLLIDSISSYFTKKEIIEIITFLKKYQETKEMNIIYTTINLEEALYTDYLYIISAKKIYLEGNPLDILKMDNIINKIGLELPFMVDLSVKLTDYELLDNIELDIERMVDSLWK